MPVPVDGVEPERDLGELDRHRVQVDSVHVAVGDEPLCPLKLVGVVRVGDPLSHLPLLARQVQLGELVDGLVQEGGGPHRRLAHRKVQDLVRRHRVRHELAQAVLHEAPGERLRGVVACGLLAVAPPQPVDERSPGVPAEPLAAVLVEVVDALAVAVAFELGSGHEPRARQVVRLGLGLPDLVEVDLGEEAAVGQERFVDGPELVDPELRVGDAAPAAARAPSAPALPRTAQRHQLDHALQDVVAQPDPVQERGRALAEEGAVERPDAEAVPERRVRGEEVRAAAPLAAVEPFPDESEEGLDALVKVESGARLLRGELDQLQIAEPFKAVSGAVGVRSDRSVAQLRPRLDVEEEEQPVHVADALQPQLAR